MPLIKAAMYNVVSVKYDLLLEKRDALPADIRKVFPGRLLQSAEPMNANERPIQIIKKRKCILNFFVYCVFCFFLLLLAT